jgi:hypothetical protein
VNRFNLTFSGEIVEGQDPELVKLRFANKFAIDDPARLERFFSGQTITLRRNLERKDAAQVYHELQLLGVVAALVKVPDTDVAEEASHPILAKASTAESTTATIKRSANGTPRQARNAAAIHKGSETVAPTTSAAPWPANSGDIAAEIKARKQAAQRLAAEKAAQEQAALDAQQREIAAAAAHEQALAAERQRIADEERALQAAEQARLAAEEAARKAAEQAQIKRLEAEELARKTALKAAAKRKAAEEAAERRAKRNREKAEKARRKAEEEAQRQFALAEKKRLVAEEEARRKAELDEKKRLAAEEEARRKAAIEEKKREAAEEEARRKAALEEKKRLAAEAEEDARLRAELQAIKRREAEEAARLQAELEEKARQAAAQAARIKAEALRLQEEAQRKSDERRRIAAEVLAAQKTQEELTQHAVAEAIHPPSSPVRLQTLKPAKARVKTALEVPLRKKGETPEIGVPGQRKRLSGEPNLYKLRPFRNTEAVRTRAALARSSMRRAATTAVLALGVLLIALGSYLQYGGKSAIEGATAIAINANSEPVLLAGDVLLLHDRAGVGTTELTLSALGVSALEPPLEFAGEDVLFGRGRLADDTANSAQQDALQVLRCDLALPRCAPLSPELQGSHIEAFVLNPLDGSVLLADRSAGQLLKVDREGVVVVRADVAIPAAPVMRLHDGLLLMNSAAGPGISVFRYEADAFAKQLDEILPLPPGGRELEAAHVGDFVWSGDAWWVNLRAGSGAGTLHRFDKEWNYRSTITLPADAGTVQLVNWGEKTLVNDTHNPAIERYNALGMAEAAFASTPLQALVSEKQQRARLTRVAWRGGLLLCALVAALGCALAYWHGLRNLVYRPRREQGALPLDDHAAALRWMEPVQNRQVHLRRIGIRYGLGVLAALSLAIGVSVSVSQLAALLLACSGPAIALLVLRRQPTGYIGVLGDSLLLVDHNGFYHLAGGSRLQYRGPFLAIDDIVVFAGSQRLPVFSPAALQQHVWPLALGGIKVDRKTMAVKLLESRHPLALGAAATIAAVAAAALLLLLPHIF